MSELNNKEICNVDENMNPVVWKCKLRKIGDLGNIADVWEDHPLSSLAIIRCYPWTRGKTALIGDAAHAGFHGV